MESTPFSSHPSSQLLTKLTRRGLTPREAAIRISLLKQTEINEFNSGAARILGGNGVQYPYQDEVNEVSYVFLIILVGVGLAAYGASRATD